MAKRPEKPVVVPPTRKMAEAAKKAKKARRRRKRAKISAKPLPGS
jgi:hypothetical protein